MTPAWWLKCTKQLSVADLPLLSCWARLSMQCQKKYSIGDPKCVVIQHLVVYIFIMTATLVWYSCIHIYKRHAKGNELV